MKHLFYFFSVFVIIYEIAVMVDPKRVADSISRLKTKDKRTTTDEIHAFFMFGYLLWNLFGLFTDQWMLFLAFFVYSVSIARFIKGAGKYGMIADASVSIAVILSAIIDAYHYNIF